MTARFFWLAEGPDSPSVSHLLVREPGMVQHRIAAAIRSILQSLTYGQIWSKPEYTMEAWRKQRVPVSLLQPLITWGASLLPETVAQLNVFPKNGDLPLRETCRHITSAWRELAAAAAPHESRRIVRPDAASWETWEATSAYPGKQIVRDFGESVRREPPPLLAALLLHGSAADGRVCPGFSDLDMHALVDTPRDASGGELEQFLSWAIDSQRALYSFNPFCHHGVMFTLDIDRRSCAEAALPSALLKHGVWIRPPHPAALEFAYAADAFGSTAAIGGFESFFESRSTQPTVLAGAFDAVWWTASVLILPLLLWQLERGESIYKREGLDRCNKLLAEQTVTAVRRVERARHQIGQWIQRHDISNKPTGQWPGIALRHARHTLLFTHSDRVAMGIDESLLIAGRQIWEDVAHRALCAMESHFAPTFSSSRERFFFSWPPALIERPRPLAADAYESARQAFLDRARANPQVAAVYEFGKTGSLGLSDLDFLVVLARDARTTPAELLLPRLPTGVAEIIGHEALFVSEDALPDLAAVFPIFDARCLYASSDAPAPLASTFDFSPEIAAPLLTRLTAFKYPHDLIWLARQPAARWKTLLAYLNSFHHVAHCLTFLGLPLAETIARCIELNAEVRARFAAHDTVAAGDLAHALKLMLDASVDAIFALEAWWRRNFPVLDLTTEPPDPSTYRAALFESLAAPSFEPPPLPPAIRAVLRRCAYSVDAREDQPPITEPLARFYKAFAAYGERLRRFLAIETAAGRAPNAYIHRPVASSVSPGVPPVRLASVAELTDPALEEFLLQLNAFAVAHGLRVMTNWSKAWEYPWIWQHALCTLTQGQLLVDLGTELSPVPWFLATRGIRCIFIETDRQFESLWIHLRESLQVDVQWHFVENELLPLADASADAVTSFSVIEHQPDKPRAIAEVVRVLRPGGFFGISFDICESEMGMTFPEWNGRALTMREFERILWFNPAFANTLPPDWNVADIPAFKQWHLRAAPHHNYVVGAAILRKRNP